MTTKRWIVTVLVAAVVGAPVRGQSPNWMNLRGTSNSSFKIGPPASALTLTNSSGVLSLSGGLTANGVVTLGTSVGAFTATGQIQSSLATGTAPISCASTTYCPNLNADSVDGIGIGGTGALGGVMYVSSATPPTLVNSAAGTTGQLMISGGTGSPTWLGLTSARLLVGNGSNLPTGVTMSGDATISNAGVLTISANAVAAAEITDGSIADSDLNASSLGKHLPRPTSQVGGESANSIVVTIWIYSTDGTTFQSDGAPVLLNISDTDKDMEAVTAKAITTTFLFGKVFNTITSNKKYMLVAPSGVNLSIFYLSAGTVYVNYVVGAKTYSATVTFS